MKILLGLAIWPLTVLALTAVWVAYSQLRGR